MREAPNPSIERTCQGPLRAPCPPLMSNVRRHMSSNQFLVASAIWHRPRRYFSLALLGACALWAAPALVGAQSELPYSSIDSWFRPYKGPELMQMTNAVRDSVSSRSPPPTRSELKSY